MILRTRGVLARAAMAALIVLAPVSAAVGEEEGRSFFVAPPDLGGHFENDGSLEAPWTIERALTRASEIHSGDAIEPGDTLWLLGDRRHPYRVFSPLTIPVSGVRIVAVPGAQPTFRGTVAVTGWERVTEDINGDDVIDSEVWFADLDRITTELVDAHCARRRSDLKVWNIEGSAWPCGSRCQEAADCKGAMADEEGDGTCENGPAIEDPYTCEQIDLPLSCEDVSCDGINGLYDLDSAAPSSFQCGLVSPLCCTCESQLFLNGRMMVEARWPDATAEELLDNDKWALATIHPQPLPTAEIPKNDPVIECDDNPVTTLELRSEPTLWPWQPHGRVEDWEGAIVSLSLRNRKITRGRTLKLLGEDRLPYVTSVRLPPREGGRCLGAVDTEEDAAVVFSRVLAALDRETEWHFDRERGRIYLAPPNGVDPNRSRVELRVNDTAIQGPGRSSEPAEAIVLKGLHFFASSFHLDYCDECAVEECHLLYPSYTLFVPENNHGVHGKAVRAMTTRVSGAGVQIKNSSLAHSVAGFRLEEMPGRAAQQRVLVSNNRILDIGWTGQVFWMGIAVYSSLPEAPDICIERNTVSHTGRVALGVYAPRAIVQLNHLYDGCNLGNDSTLLYTSRTKELGRFHYRYNWAHDSIGIGGGPFQADARCFRFDNGTDYGVIHHNVAWNCSRFGIQVAPRNNDDLADFNRVYNNTVFDSGFTTRDDRAGIKVATGRKCFESNRHSSVFNNLTNSLVVSQGGELPVVGSSGWFDEPAGAVRLCKRNYRYSEDEQLLRDVGALDFRPKNPDLFDSGVLDEYESWTTPEWYIPPAPEIGAYERGARPWRPGRKTGVLICWRPARRSFAMALMAPMFRRSLLTIVDESSGEETRCSYTPGNWMHPETCVLRGYGPFRIEGRAVGGVLRAFPGRASGCQRFWPGELLGEPCRDPGDVPGAVRAAPLP